MKKHIFTLGAAVLLLASCQNNPSQTANTVVSETATMMENTAEKVEEMVTPQLLATYVGTLPAADCGGMATGREIGRASCGKECRSRWSPYH